MAAQAGTPRLAYSKAFELITKTLRSNPKATKSSLVHVLVEAGGATNTAYRQVSAYFERGYGDHLLPSEKEAFHRFVTVAEHEVLTAETPNPHMLKLYGEAMGVIDYEPQGQSEEDRLAAAAKALAVLQGLSGPEGSDDNG